MCESSKSERPELESGHLQETDGSGKKVSRRSFLGGMALGAGCLGFGNFIGEVIKDLGSEKSQNIPIQYNDERKVPPPGSLSVAVVQLLPENAEPHQGIEKISSGVLSALGRIALTTEYLYDLNATFTRDGHSPDTTRITEDGEQPAYSKRILKTIGQAHAHETGSDTALVVVDSGDTKEYYYSGLTMYDDGQPPVAFVRDVGGVSIGTIAHELGHMLAPEGAKRGLGHAWALQPWVRQDGDKEVKDWRHSPHVASIQEIIAAGYGLEKDDSGESDPYASTYSIMGNSESFNSVDPTKPIFSAAEIAFLDPTRPIHHITTPSEGTGVIPIGCNRRDQIGVTLDIPEGHVLRQIVPDADTIFIGPIVRSKQWSNPIDRMGVFATWSGGRDSAILNPSIWDEGIKYSENSFEHVAYIDEQLGILVAAGQQSGQVYVRLVPLHTEEAQELIRAGQERLIKSLNV